MSLMDATFSYMSPPRESEMLAVDHVHEVYGMPHLTFDEREHSIRLEYDASRSTTMTWRHSCGPPEFHCK